MVPNAFFHLMKSICFYFIWYQSIFTFDEFYMFLFHMVPNAFLHRVTSYNRKFEWDFPEEMSPQTVVRYLINQSKTYP